MPIPPEMTATLPFGAPISIVRPAFVPTMKNAPWQAVSDIEQLGFTLCFRDRGHTYPHCATSCCTALGQAAFTVHLSEARF
jgi:hypothetical protein